MKKILQRRLSVDLSGGKSAFLWGPRQVGKSHWVKRQFSDATLIDLLQRDVYGEYSAKPSLLRERFSSHKKLIVIDEVQLVPDLLAEVHWLIENTRVSFLLTGSSARKLRRKGAHSLGGRARRYTMTPLTLGEIREYNIEDIMVTGLLPPHYLSSAPVADLRAYVGDYLKEEIATEASIRSIPAFAEFLRVSALTNGELLNYSNVGREAGIKAKTVREYFEILDDTLLGTRLPPWKRAKDRRLIETEKFYLFDVGVSNFLARRKPKIGTSEFGKSFEHLVLMELMAFRAYEEPDIDLRFWRTASGYEVDFIIGDFDVAIEVKGSQRAHEGDARSLHALMGEHRVKKAFIVSMEKLPRRITPQVEALPLDHFLKRLWERELV